MRVIDQRTLGATFCPLGRMFEDAEPRRAVVVFCHRSGRSYDREHLYPASEGITFLSSLETYLLHATAKTEREPCYPPGRLVVRY
jgi:hypothetical protein